MKKSITLLFITACFLFSSNAANYFVDTSKASSGVGSTWETAYKTILEAENAANANSGVDNIYIKGTPVNAPITSSSGWTLKAENYYFSCDPANSGTSTVRTMNDNDGNGIIEPWEFKYPTVFSSTYATVTGTAISLVSSTTLDGLTITHSASRINGSGATCINPIGGVIQNCVFTGCNLSYPGMIAKSNTNGCLIRTLGIFRNSLIEKNTVSVTNISSSATASENDLKIYPILDVNLPPTSTNVSISGCVFRNNKATIDYSASSATIANNLRGMVLNISNAGTSNTAGTKSTVTISDCIVHNNEIIFTGNAAITTTPNACIATHIVFSGSNTTNNWINNTFANNKSTNLKGACMALYVGGSSPDFAINAVYNNVFWNNQNTISATSVTSNVSVASGANQNIGTVFSNNLMDIGTSGNWGTNLTNTNNLTNLSGTNTTVTYGPQFVNPPLNLGANIIGSYQSAGTQLSAINQSDWRLNSGSYLIGKGAATVTTGITTDKSGFTFASTPAVGAYEAVPIITTNAATDITGNSSASGGTIVWNGGTAITESGVCWSTSQNPTTANTKTTDNAGSGSFNSNITGLSAGVTYYVRAYATNGTHTTYGSQISFTTLSSKPEPSNQATNFAKGTVTSSTIPLTFTPAIVGAQAPDAYLVKMSAGSITDPVDGTDPDDVTALTSGTANVKVTASPVSSFSGLTAGTMYHYKMYSYTNSGTQIDFNTTSAPTLDVATLPAAVTGVSLTPTLTDFSSTALTADLSWTQPGTYDAANHTTLVFVKYNSPITVSTPTNAPSFYTASTNLATGSNGTPYQGDATAYCVYKGDGTSVSLTGMTSGATYHVLVITVYDTNNSDGSYSYSTGTTTNAAMFKKEPPSYCSNLAVANVTTTSIDLNWTSAATGSQAPDGYLVVSKALGSVPMPVDGTDQTDVTAYTSGLANKKVTPQSATGMSSFTNMIAGTSYFYKVFTYTNSGAQINYKTSGSTPALTFSTLPNAVSNAGITMSSATTASISWTAASGYNTGRHSTLVFVKAGSAIIQGSPILAPISYTANTSIGSGTAYEGDAAAYCVYNGDGNNVSITGLAANTSYHVLIYTVVDLSNSNSTNSYSEAVIANTIAVGADNNISNISTGATTELNINVGELIINQNTALKSINVAPGAKLTVNNGVELSANSIVLRNTANGTASFVDSREADAPPAIAGTVKQTITSSNRNWYVTVPVSGQTATGITLTGAKIVQRNEAQSRWDDVLSNVGLTTGVGYIAVASANADSTIWTMNGNFNSGNIGVTLTASGSSSTGFNLVGNPYPSYLNWEQVLNLNAGNATLVQPTIWYRTATWNNGANKYDYTFQTYNSTSRIAVPSSVSGYIPPMQAFWVRAKNGGTLQFTNAMRSHGNGNVGFASTNLMKTKSTADVAQQILRLQVNNTTTGNADETVLYFNSNAQNGFDAYDSPKMLNNNALPTAIPDIYTVEGTENLVINGMNAIPYDTTIPLGFAPGNGVSFTLKATELSNFESGTQILLKDIETGVTTDFTTGETYSFSNSTTQDGRFWLIFKAPSITTGLNPVNQSNNDNLKVWISCNKNNQITVNCEDITGNSKVSVYNSLGQKVIEKKLSKTITTLDNSLESGIYVVSVTAGKETITKKVILK